jgi:hypothetical protein
VRDLDDARTRQIRAHREYQRLEKTIGSLRRPYAIGFRLSLGSQKAIAEFKMEPPLELVSLGKRAY